MLCAVLVGMCGLLLVVGVWGLGLLLFDVCRVSCVVACCVLFVVCRVLLVVSC